MSDICVSTHIAETRATRTSALSSVLW